MLLKSLKKKFTMKRYMVWLINLINIFVLLLSQMMINPVYADDDSEWLQLNDFETWTSYNFWRSYGLTADNSSSYTNTLNTISESTSTGTFTFTGDFSGSFNAGITLSYFGEIGDSDLGVASIISTENVHIGSASNPSQTIEMTIRPLDTETHQNNGFAFACTYNAQSTSTNALMDCHPTSGVAETVILPDQTILVDKLEVFGGVQGTYLVKMKNEGTEQGTLSGSLSLSGSGQGTLNISESGTSTTTSVNVNSLRWVIPTMSGNLNHEKALNKRLKVLPNEYTSIYLLSATAASFNVLLNNIYDYNDGTSLNDVLNINNIGDDFNRFRGGLNLVGIRLKSTDNKSHYVYLDFNDNNAFFKTNGIIPLFVGIEKYMSDDLYRFIFGSDRLIELLRDGNNTSQNAGHDISVAGGDFQEYGDDLINIESDVGFDMGNAVDNVQLNNSIISTNGFLNAANWVRIQFDNLTSFSPINSVLVFSLSLGFAMLIIGKIR